jgi:hypothetical protein
MSAKKNVARVAKDLKDGPSFMPRGVRRTGITTIAKTATPQTPKRVGKKISRRTGPVKGSVLPKITNGICGDCA